MKPTYEKPQVIDLNVPKAWGAPCSSGGTAAGPCANGPNATIYETCNQGRWHSGPGPCTQGGSAGSGCNAGNNYNPAS